MRILLSTAVLLLLATACASGAAIAPAPSPVAGFPLSLTDDAGRAVAVAAPPQRIVSLSPGNTEILFYLGLQERVVGVDDYSNYPPEAKSKEKVGGFASTNLEKVVALGPDLVLAADIHVQKIVPELEQRGLQVVVLTPQRLEDVVDSLRLVGKIGGRETDARQAAGRLQARITAVTEKTSKAPLRPRVFFEVDATPVSVGPGTFVHDLIVKAGGDNIAADAQSKWPRLSPEAIVLRDPEVVILADHGFGETPEKVKARPGWDKTSAVRHDRVVPINPDLTNRPGPRAVDGLEYLAKVFHPEAFR